MNKIKFVSWPTSNCTIRSYQAPDSVHPSLATLASSMPSLFLPQGFCILSQIKDGHIFFDTPSMEERLVLAPPFKLGDICFCYDQ